MVERERVMENAKNTTGDFYKDLCGVEDAIRVRGDMNKAYLSCFFSSVRREKTLQNVLETENPEMIKKFKEPSHNLPADYEAFKLLLTKSAY